MPPLGPAASAHLRPPGRSEIPGERPHSYGWQRRESRPCAICAGGPGASRRPIRPFASRCIGVCVGPGLALFLPAPGSQLGPAGSCAQRGAAAEPAPRSDPVCRSSASPLAQERSPSAAPPPPAPSRSGRALGTGGTAGPPAGSEAGLARRVAPQPFSAGRARRVMPRQRGDRSPRPLTDFCDRAGGCRFLPCREAAEGPDGEGGRQAGRQGPVCTQCPRVTSPVGPATGPRQREGSVHPRYRVSSLAPPPRGSELPAQPGTSRIPAPARRTAGLARVGVQGGPLCPGPAPGGGPAASSPPERPLPASSGRL